MWRSADGIVAKEVRNDKEYAGMRHLLAISIIGIVTALVASCGLEELESASKFISKTQEDPTLTTGSKHRPGGLHANAYLINKVHVKDNDENSEGCTGNRLNETCNLTVEANVGWWAIPVTACAGFCTPTAGFLGAGKTVITPPTCTDKVNATKSHNCAIRYCTGTSAAAATEVNAAIDLWLAPLRTPYNKVSDPIVSTNNTSLRGTYTSGGKTPNADLIINFICSAAKASYPAWETHNDKDQLNCTPGTSYKGGCPGI